MIKLRYVLLAALPIAAFSMIQEQCSSSSIKSSVEEGQLTKAVKQVDDATPRKTTTQLIGELVKVGKLDKAAEVLVKTTRGRAYLSKEEDRVSYNKVYKAFIKAGRYDEAWDYHELDNSNPDSELNAAQYYAYLVDVLTDMSMKNKLEDAHDFLKVHLLWFTKHVDTSSRDRIKVEYSTETVRARLEQVILDLEE